MNTRNKHVGVINAGIGNWSSVVNAFDYVGISAASVSNPDELYGFSHAVLPGVGNFSKASSLLKAAGWSNAIKGFVARGDPFLGICLGMQLLGKSSEEGDSEGLGVLDFSTVALSASGPQRVPHIGWATVRHESGSPLLSGLSLEARFYFSHGFAIQENATCSVGRTSHNESFISVVALGQVFGVQFHPEKSHENGQKLLTNFAGL